MSASHYLLANEPSGLQTLFDVLSIPGWVIGIAAITILLLSGKIMRRSDHEDMIANKEREHERIVQAHRDRIEQLRLDRDAWRSAHGEEVQARQAAERAAAHLMEGTATVNSLIIALQDALRTKDR